jgi:hypothetical protein
MDRAAKKRKLYGVDVDEIIGNEEFDSELGLGRRKRKKVNLNLS